MGYETLDPKGTPSPTTLDGYVVTADGDLFYEKYNDSTENIDRTKLTTCKRTLKNSNLPIYDIECNINGEEFKSNMNDIRKVNGPTFEQK